MVIRADDKGGAPAIFFISNADSQFSGGDYIRVESPDATLVFQIRSSADAFLLGGLEVNSNLQSRGFSLRATDDSGTINFNTSESMSGDYSLTYPLAQGAGALVNDGMGNLEFSIADAVADIADPGTATPADCANKINELLGVLRAAGLLDT